ncbi:hypothetical protein [Salinibacter altiplanensis]|uniref:hypothetical protein n=1 Tax=Salinibacter altiplanensis TaxID=1803181 RepID=UPI000C9FF89D|nr:hypothetical protein [Salinibacter altiplanensis]
MYFRSALLFSCVALALLLVGCRGGGGLDVAQGQYRFVVEGSLADTLTGPATVQSHDNGRVGIELGARGAPGLSMELVPAARTTDGAGAPLAPVSPGRYNVVAASLLDTPSPDSLSGLLAFLSVAGREFVAMQGHLSVTRVSDEAAEGRIELEMAEQAAPTSGNHAVRVSGALRATMP